MKYAILGQIASVSPHGVIRDTENRSASYKTVYFNHHICLVVFYHRYRNVCVDHLVIYAIIGQIGSKNSPPDALVCGHENLKSVVQGH